MVYLDYGDSCSASAAAAATSVVDDDDEIVEASQLFEDAWCWFQTPMPEQPETIAAVLLAVIAKKIIWHNNYCRESTNFG